MSFIGKCLTGSEDHANKNTASLKEISRWQGPVHTATAPFFAALYCLSSICTSIISFVPHAITMRQQVWYYYARSVDNENKTQREYRAHLKSPRPWGRAGLTCRSPSSFLPPGSVCLTSLSPQIPFKHLTTS